MPSDTDYGSLGEQRKHKFAKFDPTLSMGNLLTIATILGGFITFYTSLQTERATTRMELDSVKASAAAEKAATRENLSEIKGDVKELQRSTNQVLQSLAVIQAQQPPAKGNP